MAEFKIGDIVYVDIDSPNLYWSPPFPWRGKQFTISCISYKPTGGISQCKLATLGWIDPKYISKTEKVRSMTKFYLVWRDGSVVSKFKHYSYNNAKTEAERLAAANPQYEFIVLESKSYSKVTTPVRTVEFDEIPF